MFSNYNGTIVTMVQLLYFGDPWHLFEKWVLPNGAKSMSKKQLILTIDEEVIEKAKKHIPNISGFVEECLKHHLGLADGTYPVELWG